MFLYSRFICVFYKDLRAKTKFGIRRFHAFAEIVNRLNYLKTSAKRAAMQFGCMGKVVSKAGGGGRRFGGKWTQCWLWAGQPVVWL